MSENRHPAGTSLGGQWAPGSAAEIDSDDDFSAPTPLVERVSASETGSLVRSYPRGDLYADVSDMSSSKSEYDYEFDEMQDASGRFSSEMNSFSLTHRAIDPEGHAQSRSDYEKVNESVGDYEYDSQQVIRNQVEAADRIHDRVFGDSGAILSRERAASSAATKRLLDDDGESGIDQAINGELDSDDEALVSEGISDAVVRAQAAHRENDAYSAEDLRHFYAKAGNEHQGIKAQAKAYRMLKETLMRRSR